jgi:sugar phosphate permease
MPAVFVTYSLAYLDRANFGFGAAAGLAATLHISGKQLSLLGGLFFLGYFAFQIPGAMFARKRSASWLVFAALIGWGTCAALTGVIRVFWLLALDRFALGVAESVIFPSMLFLLTHWFTRAERSRANVFLILGNPVTVLWMSAITGYLIDAFGWQKTFILEGAPSILWAIVWVVFVKDRPGKASWMTPEAAATLERALTEEQDTVKHGTRDMGKALLRPDVVVLAVQFFFWSLGVYGFVLWLPMIVRQGSALSMGRTGLLAAVPYLAAVVLMVTVSYVSDRTCKRQALVWPFLLMAGVALMGSFLLADRSFALAFACLVVAGGCMYAPYGPYWSIVPERLPREVTAEVLAMINTSGALGGFAGSYLVGWLQVVTGKPRAGFLLMSLSLVVSGLLVLWLPDGPKAQRAASTI